MTTPLFFCITHKQPEWPLPEFLTMVGTGGYVPERGIALSQRYPELAFQNEHLGEFAALFAIRRMLEGQSPTGMFGICHYRRFALTQPLGEMRGFNSYAHPSLLAQARPEHFFGDGNKIIVPSRVHFEGSVLRQYAAVAEARDLMMYFGAAVDAGAVDQNAAADFLSQNSFIPACTAAYLPVGWFVDIVTRVEMATQQFMKTVHIEREGQQKRNAGFCAERFHSLLLQQYIHQYGWDNVITTPMTMLTDDGARH
ncbi:hypothetical protein GTP56_26865 [Duganella sp. FT134W]|uniref:Uncharacterized protein n=1 Tax=Duganella margarita TaxID=2692170 RepID=A0A7X4KJP4_9BURK|nr:hypothetical protein [Duganella margarita]MYM75790.1 hypothetical protein [Duganella margarita]